MAKLPPEEQLDPDVNEGVTGEEFAKLLDQSSKIGEDEADAPDLEGMDEEPEPSEDEEIEDVAIPETEDDDVEEELNQEEG